RYNSPKVGIERRKPTSVLTPSYAFSLSSSMLVQRAQTSSGSFFRPRHEERMSLDAPSACLTEVQLFKIAPSAYFPASSSAFGPMAARRVGMGRLGGATWRVARVILTISPSNVTVSPASSL